MKKILKVLAISISSIVFFCIALVMHERYLKKKAERKLEEAKKDKEEQLSFLEKHRREGEKIQAEMYERFYKDLENGNIPKIFYETFKDVFGYPELPEGYVFPEDKEKK